MTAFLAIEIGPSPNFPGTGFPAIETNRAENSSGAVLEFALYDL
jgi:hypothetical protein